MKLAEALSLRADAQKRIEQVRQRLLRNAKVQEGDTPAENPAALLEELERVSAECLQLIQRINRTNAATVLEGTTTLADALAARDLFGQRQAIYRDMAAAATVTQDRQTRSEVKFRGTVSVTAMQRRADDLARDFRTLDVRIQEANWRTDLAD